MLKSSLLRTARATARSASRVQPPVAAIFLARRFSTTKVQREEATAEALNSAEPELQAHFGPRASITHQVSSLSPSALYSRTTLGGWLVNRRQANSTLCFLNLKDTSGQVQLVINAKKFGNANQEAGQRAIEEMMRLPLHSVIQVEGTIQHKVSTDKSIKSDSVEILVDKYTLLNPAQRTLPFYPNSRDDPANETLRSQYRYLDLRSDKLGENIRKRSRVTKLIRDYLHDLEFTEVETPVLLQSSPEGAREYLVPTRLPSSVSSSTGTGEASTSEPLFYALQQSPQQPKQLLISSGLTSKYFQVARCFRDESGRKDRQAEFTQVDLEMGFVSGTAVPSSGAEGMRSTWRIGGGEIREVIEGLVKKIWKEIEGVDLPGWFQVMPYEVAMDVYGSDKPDTRFKMYTLPIAYYPALSDADIDKLLADDKPDTVEFMITPKQDAGLLQIDKLAEETQDVERIEITTANRSSWTSESELLRPFELQPEASRPGGAEVGDIVWLAKRRKQPDAGWTKLGRLRVKLRDQLVEAGALVLPKDPHFLWITEFPLFTRSDEDKEFMAKGRWSSSHHPFTAPMYEDMENLKNGKVELVRGQHYDLVLNGMEIGGGSVRIHDAKLQEHVFEQVLELDEKEIARFGHLLQALKFGAPPHGGIALGLDRIVAILCGTSSIRDVIAFPKTAGGIDPVFKSPSPAPAADVLAGYGLKRA